MDVGLGPAEVVSSVDVATVLILVLVDVGLGLGKNVSAEQFTGRS